MSLPGAGETSQDELAGFTPAFLWLLRDFYLSLEEDADGQVSRCACSWHSVLPATDSRSHPDSRLHPMQCLTRSR